MEKARKSMPYLSNLKSINTCKTEDEIIDNLTEVVQQIINEEMQIRERLTQYNELETLDRIYRSLGITK